MLPHVGTLNSSYLSIRSLPQLSFIRKIDLAFRLALGESVAWLAQPQRNTDVYKGLFPREGFLGQSCINHLRREKGCKLMDQI